MRVEIWSDVVCPWCYIGKRRFEQAVDEFEYAGEVEVVWRSFELDPGAPRERELSYVEHLASKYRVVLDEAQAMVDRMVETGEREGIEFRFDRSRAGNTFDAHRLLHWARSVGGGSAQGELGERLFQATFTEGVPIGDAAALAALAPDVGLSEQEAAAVLASADFTDDVRADEQEAAALGARGVPFFVIDRRYAVSGAQTSDLLVQALEAAWKDSPAA